MRREIVLTADGSSSVYVPDLQIMYHSKYGSIQESNHVFIQAGLYYYIQQHALPAMHIFEMGFGTGLNALLTAIEATALKKHIEYTAVEKYPLTAEEINKVNYSSILNSSTFFTDIHSAAWNNNTLIHPYFSIQKVNNSLQQLPYSNMFNIIYYDAFAPAAQPELWTEQQFSQLYNMLQMNGILVTYCSKGNVRRAMQQVGFTIEKIKGPVGKREMLRATKK